VVTRLRADGRYDPGMHEPIEVVDDSPAEISRATQAIAEALEAMVAEAPEQWYTFKPMWPATAAEADEVARRAAGFGPADA
jgi:lauroyl/myristoyl acyltransferase